MAEKKLFLLDAFALIYRAHFAFARNPRFNSKGMNTSAIFGFTNSLLEVLNNQKPTQDEGRPRRPRAGCWCLRPEGAGKLKTISI